MSNGIRLIVVRFCCLWTLGFSLSIDIESANKCNFRRANGLCVPRNDCELRIGAEDFVFEEIFNELQERSKLCGNISNLVCCENKKVIIDKMTLFDQETCGVQVNNKIAYGYDTEINEFPWMAILGFNHLDSIQFGCGGSLISRRFVLTAAHCLTPNLKLVRLGEHNITNPGPDCSIEDDSVCTDPVQDIPVEEMIPHPKYNQTGKREHDIGLIRLRQAANVTQQNILPICLPFQKEQRKPWNFTIITGFGLTENSTDLSWAPAEIMQQTRLEVEPFDICEKKFKQLRDDPSRESKICTRARADSLPSQTCRGDSGSPAHFTVLQRMIQVGIVSTGSTGCAKKRRPISILVNVTSYLDWILENVYA